MSNINRPKPITLKLKRYTLTAYANRKPKANETNWSWSMYIKRKGEPKKYFALGRVAIKEVRHVMKATFRKEKPVQYGEDVCKKTIGNVLNLWFVSKIESRSPSSKIRKEYRLSIHTVSNYRSSIKTLTLGTEFTCLLFCEQLVNAPPHCTYLPALDV